MLGKYSVAAPSDTKKVKFLYINKILLITENGLKKRRKSDALLEMPTTNRIAFLWTSLFLFNTCA